MLTREMKSKLLSYLRDDVGGGDVTSAVLKPERCRAAVKADEACTLAGLEEAAFLFRGGKCKVKLPAKDGQKIKKGKIVMRIDGINRDILKVERAALNVMGRMSGVATVCRNAQEIAGKRAMVALTRKTMPGFNIFDKKAAEIAGIWSHRANLNSFVLIKDNHLAFYKSPAEAVRAARGKYGKRMKIEVETFSPKQALQAAGEKPDMIMLDNFSAKQARETVKKLRAAGFKGKIELSGGINMGNLGAFAKAGAYIISMGSLTCSAPSCNFSLEIKNN